MLVVGGGGGGRGHDGVGGDDGGAQAGRHRGAGGRRQGQPLTTSTGLLATPAFLVLFWCLSVLLFWSDGLFPSLQLVWISILWACSLEAPRVSSGMCIQILVQTFTPLPTYILIGYLGRVLSSSMEVWWRLRLPEE